MVAKVHPTGEIKTSREADEPVEAVTATNASSERDVRGLVTWKQGFLRGHTGQAATNGLWRPGEVAMETWMVIAIAVLAVAALGVIWAVVFRSERRQSAEQTTRLREGFGPEYAKAVGEQGRSGAEGDLLGRQQRADLFEVRTLSATEVTRYTHRWTATQAQFVDDPGAALIAADHLVTEVIGACGYPIAEFEQGASALSVDHPRAVQNYRGAHELLLRNQRNALPTDDLRAGMVQFRAVLTELMDRSAVAPPVHAI
jgi:hypothetical protein